MAEIDELRTRMATLEVLVRDLRVELATSLSGRFRSMRDSRRCPACGGEKLFHFPDALEMTHGGVTPMMVYHERKFWGPKEGGPLEHFVCRTCMLVESHARDLDGIVPNGKDVIAIDPEDKPEPPGPYR